MPRRAGRSETFGAEGDLLGCRYGQSRRGAGSSGCGKSSSAQRYVPGVPSVTNHSHAHRCVCEGCMALTGAICLDKHAPNRKRAIHGYVLVRCPSQWASFSTNHVRLAYSMHVRRTLSAMDLPSCDSRINCFLMPLRAFTSNRPRPLVLPTMLRSRGMTRL